MKTLRVKLTFGVVVFTMLVYTVSAIPFRGELTGVWTAGVAEFGIAPGDSFKWYYTYESEDVNGQFYSVQNGGALTVFRNDIPGLEGRMDWGADGFLTVKDVHVFQACFGYQFDDPRIHAVSMFTIGLHSFSGFGEGIVTYADPESCLRYH